MSSVTTEARKCVRCGAEYQPTSNRQRYCTDCGKYGKGICEHCGKEFQLKGNTSGKYCSRDCRNEHVTNPALAKRPCAICGTVFKPNTYGRVTCSRKCGGMYQRKRYKVCKVCGTEFVGKTAAQVTCSHECAGVLRRGSRNTHCERCGKELPYSSYLAQRFCSKECRQLPIGTLIPAPNGYVYIRVGENYPTANREKNVLEHRYVMEQSIGRSLEKHEYVHHLNGDRKDNRIENLELWTGNHLQGIRVTDKLYEQFMSQPEIQALDKQSREQVLNALKRITHT